MLTRMPERREGRKVQKNRQIRIIIVHSGQKKYVPNPKRAQRPPSPEESGQIEPVTHFCPVAEPNGNDLLDSFAIENLLLHGKHVRLKPAGRWQKSRIEALAVLVSKKSGMQPIAVIRVYKNYPMACQGIIPRVNVHHWLQTLNNSETLEITVPRSATVAFYGPVTDLIPCAISVLNIKIGAANFTLCRGT